MNPDRLHWSHLLIILIHWNSSSLLPANHSSLWIPYEQLTSPIASSAAAGGLRLGPRPTAWNKCWLSGIPPDSCSRLEWKSIGRKWWKHGGTWSHIWYAARNEYRIVVYGWCHSSKVAWIARCYSRRVLAVPGSGQRDLEWRRQAPGGVRLTVEEHPGPFRISDAHH